MSFSTEVRAAFRRGETDAVVRMSEAEIARAAAAGDIVNEVEARYSLARVAIRGGDLPLGATRAREALEVALRSGDRSLAERPRHVLAGIARMSGDYTRARGLYQESIALNESLGRTEAVNWERHNLAFCELKLGNLAAARDLFASVRAAIFAAGWSDFVPYACVAGAALASAEGDHARAALLVGVTDAAFAAIGQVPDPDDAADLADIRTAAVAALGGRTFDEAYARGRLLDPRAAFA